MAFEKIDPKADFCAMERDVLRFWNETKAFDKLRQLNAGKPKWSFLDGPITANNPMGVHHAWGRTYKDVYQRYHASIGRELRYQNGFDCQGLWVEVEVEKEHGFKCKKDIETYGIGKFVEECKARANKFAGQQTEQSKRLGYWMDWDNSYYTMSDENNYGIWAFLKKCFDKDLVYKGVDVMPWCPRCGTGISQMEMNEGYHEVGHTSVFVTFPLKDRPGENLLVWTTTPWTLSSNVAAAVKPDMTYIQVKQGDQSYYVGKANFENARSQPVQSLNKNKLPSLMAIKALFKNNGPFEIVKELLGEQLVGLTYEGPFDMLEGAAEAVDVHRVIAWKEVTESEGTGIVHIAPGCGSEDYHLGKELDLPQIAPLQEDGTFKPMFGYLSGKKFDQVAEEILTDLKSRHRLFAKEQYFHRYPHCWRCKDELVYRLVDEWFIKMDWRDKIMASSKQAQWIPSWGLERELDWLRNMGDWMISKKRYWGLALPIWECKKCNHFEVIGSKEELQSRTVSGWEEFEGHSPHRPWVDEVKICCSKCGSNDVCRVKEVGNPWLDASIVPFSTMGYFSDRKYWEQWFPADFVVEALPGQFRNWFYALLTVSTMMTDSPPFKVLKGHGLVMDDQGKPMHKSDGNAIWFDQAAEDIGVDVMRWLYASTPPEHNVHFGPHHCDEVRRAAILPWWNIYSFFCNLARVDDFKPDQHTCDMQDRTDLDRWILSDLNKLVGVAHEAYSTFDVAMLCTQAKQFLDLLSTWYVRRSRRRFYGEGWPTEKRAAYATLYEVLTTFNRIIAPIVPFLSETIYKNLVVNQQTDAADSIHHVPFPQVNESLIDDKLSALVAASLKIMTLARSARKESKLKVRQPLALLEVVPGDAIEREAVDRFQDHFLEELNVKSVVIRESAEGMVTLTAKANMKTLGPKFGKDGAAVKNSLADVDGDRIAASLAEKGSFVLVINDHEFTLDREDITIQRHYPEGWAGACDGQTTVLLDTTITKELRSEGLARDIVRNVQNLRKDAKLDIADRIILSLQSESDSLKQAIESFEPYIKSETLSLELSTTPLAKPLSQTEIKLGDDQLIIALAKSP